MGTEKEVLLEVKNIHKRFGSTVALKGVDLKICRGEIHGLVGENGSGKSTVTSIISGMQGCDEGEMYYLGKAWNPSNMIEAQRQGISMILQEANTISGVTVAENLFAGKEWEFTTWGIVSDKKMNAQADQLLQSFGIENIHGADSIEQYGFEERKLIEICRAVTEDTQILVVDETTTALSHTGRKLLYGLIKKMAEQGKAVIFISHDMDEILENCNILTVLRDGDIIGTLESEEMEARKIRYMMVGREIGDAYYREDYDCSCSEHIALEFKNCTFGKIHDFSLQLHKGEIVGIGGLSGSGMHEIGRAAFGLCKIKGGQVECAGRVITDTLCAINSNIGYISKNRDTEALILDGNIRDNILLPNIPAISSKRAGYLSKKRSKQISHGQIQAFQIKCNNDSQYVSTLSGGNKQKVSFAKWMAKGSDVFIMDCPTRGVDIGVKQSMYQLIAKMKEEGKAILLISEELPELLGMCDRILIMKDNVVSGSVQRDIDLKETDLIEYII